MITTATDNVSCPASGEAIIDLGAPATGVYRINQGAGIGGVAVPSMLDQNRYYRVHNTSNVVQTISCHYLIVTIK